MDLHEARAVLLKAEGDADRVDPHTYRDALRTALKAVTPVDPRLPYETEVRGSETTERHEAFGLVSIHRCNGHVKLFGSHLARQDVFFRLEVRRADVGHDLSRDWYYPREHILELNLSAAQFADMITTMNMGSGTPCTVVRVLGRELDPVPQKVQSEAQKVRASFKEDLKDLALSLFTKSKKVDELLEKKSLTQSDRKEISSVLRIALQEVKDNLPFVFTSFQESTEKVISHAKAEIDAAISMSIHRIGVEGMAQKLAAGEDPLKALQKDNE